MMQLTRRRGVSSIIGTIFFVFIMMIAIGALAYVSSLQNQSVQAEQVGLNQMASKASASLTFQNLNGLSVTNAGPAGLNIVDLFLKFANGSIYTIGENSQVPSGGNQGISPLVSGACGGSSCSSKYNTLLRSNNPADTIGVLTSSGASFWYAPSSESSIPNSCGGIGTLSMQVSPSGAGMTSPGSVTEYCDGQTVAVEAFAAPGYGFSSWSGSGAGSYTGTANPATVTVNSLVTETANFVSGTTSPYGLGATLVYVTSATQSTSSTPFAPVQRLSFAGSANSVYVVELNWSFYQSGGTNVVTFGISVPSGTTYLACGGLSYAPGINIGTDYYSCNSAPNTSLGITYTNAGSSNYYCTSSSSTCGFVEHVVVTFGSSGGTFQLEYETTSNSYTVYVLANSIMEVTPLV